MVLLAVKPYIQSHLKPFFSSFFQTVSQIFENFWIYYVQSYILSQPMEYMTSVLKYEMSDNLGGKLRIFVQPFLKIDANRLFLSVFAIKKHFE